MRSTLPASASALASARASVSALAVTLVLAATACPAGDEPSTPGDASTGTPDDAGDATTEDAPPADADATATLPPAETGEPAAWIEAGWGLSEWNAFDGVLPMVIGPQGLAMFSIPLRGRGFHNPEYPGFDNPDIPILQAWVDVEGREGHLSEVIDYPALFYPSMDDPTLLEGTAVWLVIPDTVDPSSLVGVQAHLHVEMVDADGLALEDDHALVIGEVRSGADRRPARRM